MIWLKLPEVPVKVIVYVAGGVPLGTPPPPLPPPPPPQATQNVAKNNAIVMPTPTRRRSAGNEPAKIAKARRERTHGSSTRMLAPGVNTVNPATTAGRAVVVTVTLAVEAVAPLNVTEEGEREQVDAGGCPEQVSATVWLKPFDGVTVKVEVAD